MAELGSCSIIAAIRIPLWIHSALLSNIQSVPKMTQLVFVETSSNLHQI